MTFQPGDSGQCWVLEAKQVELSLGRAVEGQAATKKETTVGACCKASNFLGMVLSRNYNSCVREIIFPVIEVI